MLFQCKVKQAGSFPRLLNTHILSKVPQELIEVRHLPQAFSEHSTIK